MATPELLTEVGNLRTEVAALRTGQEGLRILFDLRFQTLENQLTDRLASIQTQLANMANSTGGCKDHETRIRALEDAGRATNLKTSGSALIGLLALIYTIVKQFLPGMPP